MVTVLLVLLILILIGGMPPLHLVQHDYGWGPSSTATILLLVLLVLLLRGRL